MLELKNVNKYFNKGRRNQIHVINNTSLSLNDKGLIALLGPSGCGKTTLLNTIGGLDKIKSGNVYIDGKKINSKSVRKIDKIRNLNIGYIFQDYKLIEYLSVYDNVAIVLKMLGLKDKEEIKKRVEYVLDKVGMLRYKKRPVSMLSGGERQRVGIARAIVKDPNIILADEPTGNLDSKNTLEIMKIIKSISEDRLVILVTHEQELAKFYATRIIELEDGMIIKDYLNDLDGELDYRQDNTFYLKDFSNQDRLIKKDNGSIDVQVYSNKDIDLKLDIVVKNGNIYIKNRNQTKIEVIDDNSSIEFIDEHYKKLEKKNAFQYKFDFEKLEIPDVNKRYSSIFNFFQFLRNGFVRVFNFPILKKVLLIGFFLAGMFIMYSVSSITATLTIKDDDFIDKHQNYIEIKQGKFKIDEYLKYEKLDNVDYVIPSNSKVTFGIQLDQYYQTQRGVGGLTGSIAKVDLLDEDTIVNGRVLENDYEIVVDKMIIEKALNNNDTFQMVGITEVEEFLDKVVNIKYLDDFKIVGITDSDNPVIYVTENILPNIVANVTSDDEYGYYDIYMMEDSDEGSFKLLDYQLYQNKITITKGKLPKNDYEVIVPSSLKDLMPLNKEISMTVNQKKLVVVGYYDSMESYSYYFVNSKMIQYQTIGKAKSIIISPKIGYKDAVLEDFISNGINAKDCYQESKKNYLKQKQENINATVIVSGIILLISLIEIFLMIRSSFLSRVKEVGIYRAIGVKRCDVYKMFIGEIIAITTIAGIPGLILMAYILSILSKIKYIANFIVVTPMIVGLSIVFIYIFNLIIGLIPVYNTIRKTPAEILSRYDLD